MSAHVRNWAKCGNFELLLIKGAGWIEGATQGNVAGLLERKTKCIQAGCLKIFNEELLSVAEEMHQQLGACAQSISANLESEAKDPEVVRPKTTTALVEIANIS